MDYLNSHYPIEKLVVQKIQNYTLFNYLSNQIPILPTTYYANYHLTNYLSTYLLT
jgi:hypothetical protein